MSTHPNVILLLELTPDDLPRRTMRAIIPSWEGNEDGFELKVGDAKYSVFVADSDYYESMQISTKEGRLLFYDMVTYGYGEKIAWSKLEQQKAALEDWAKTVCEQHHCAYEISVTANYW